MRKNGVWDVTFANTTVRLPTAVRKKAWQKRSKALRYTRGLRVEEGGDVCFAVSCRHCKDPICVKSCISGALSINDGVINIDQDKCVGCRTCVLVCPYGCITPTETGVMQKCELCLKNSVGEPACVKGCPNRAIIYEES